MRLYKIPFDIKHEEKVFGGYLSIRQALYLLLTILSAGIAYIVAYKKGYKHGYADATRADIDYC